MSHTELASRILPNSDWKCNSPARGIRVEQRAQCAAQHLLKIKHLPGNRAERVRVTFVIVEGIRILPDNRRNLSA